MPMTRYYLAGATIPEPFREADRIQDEKHKNDPKIVREPIEVPMPIVTGPTSAKEEIYVTEDWYLKKKKKLLTEKAIDKKEMQVEMMQLLAKRDRIRYKLGTLNPASKSDSREIVKLNCKLKDIEVELRVLQDQSGIKIDELDHGTKFGRFVGNVKRTAKKVAKKVKRFFKRNEELVINILAISIPLVITGLFRSVTKTTAAAYHA